MRIGIIGSGNVGGALGRRWSETGHTVVFGSRDPQSGKMKGIVAQAGGNASSGTLEQAAACEVLLLSTHWPATQQIVTSLGDLGGRVLIDATNPLRPDLSGLEIGNTTSAGEQVAQWARGARVVKAFNSIGFPVMLNPVLDGHKAALFYCGDDERAKKTVHELASGIGFDARDAGPLTQSRTLESLALLWVSLAFTRGYGTSFAFQVIGKPAA